MTLANKQYSTILHGLGFLIFHGVLSSCVSIPGKGGTVHHLIIGFGIVSVNEPPSQAVIATDSHILGISISDQPGLKFAFGYSSSTVVSIPDGADDVRVEVSKVPGKPLIIDVPSAKFMKDAVLKGDEKNAESR
jgi:hypothetical protein